MSIEGSNIINNNKSIIFQNVKISDIQSNGNVIKINGKYVDIQWNNVTITNSYSNGSYLKSDSENIHFQVNHFNFSNNINTNKLENGFFHFENSMVINIKNSGFYDNKSQSTGILYLDNIENINLVVDHSNFENNECVFNGGIIYFNNDKDIDIDNTTIKKVSIINSIFKMNKVKYFGGVFYLNINKTYDMTIKDNIFFNNYAGVAGGVAFLNI
ncbi:hypothetical protein LY90DRAFT_58697 [Neocallimastix californiae]|uniref:Right handed beta helix domain-containing protein n=1 Tax=Neocallimastix californiae TaxID=1754190 RepID=A0A1Y2BPS8_9FUNG|nr:hypothetical protein LY90DRAFT_58697 [Neocallimastix californiae]|eukprot:ORY36617.1 hypothetical protein LY90DRAFT_58697 [Neocallimastix californiae]